MHGESLRTTVTFTDDGNNVYTVLSVGTVKAELLVNALFNCSLTQRLLVGKVPIWISPRGISTRSSLPVMQSARRMDSLRWTLVVVAVTGERISTWPGMGLL